MQDFLEDFFFLKGDPWKTWKKSEPLFLGMAVFYRSLTWEDFSSPRAWKQNEKPSLHFQRRRHMGEKTQKTPEVSLGLAGQERPRENRKTLNC